VKRLQRVSQGGATLVVSLIMLTLITLMILAALAIGLANFRTVSNMQFRDEALAAANKALDQVTSTPFTVTPAAEEVFVDLDDDGKFDYRVNIATPQCIKATLDANTPPSSLSLPPEMATASNWITTWEIQATVQGISTIPLIGVVNAGDASVDVRTGVRVLLSGAQKDTVCT
jgi:Tfp pilus assembly protein PilX